MKHEAQYIEPMRWPGIERDIAARAAWRVPTQCLVCRGWGRDALCDACRGRFASAAARCTGCGARTPLPVARCGACLAEPLNLDHVVCACDYAFPWSTLIARFKFGREVDLAAPFAALLADAVERSGAPLPERIVAVPLGPRRLAERGFNQAWELARRVARRLGVRADADRLQRPVDGPHQVGLALEQRRINPRGRFVVSARRRDELRGARVAVVDDVMTSGATLAEAAATLRRAGAARVDAWALARTPAPGEG